MRLLKKHCLVATVAPTMLLYKYFEQMIHDLMSKLRFIGTLLTDNGEYAVYR